MDQPHCSNCKVTLKKPLYCPCKQAAYCSKKCQKAQWKQHKKEFHEDDVKKNSSKRSKKNETEFTVDRLQEYFASKGYEEEDMKMEFGEDYIKYKGCTFTREMFMIALGTKEKRQAIQNVHEQSHLDGVSP